MQSEWNFDQIFSGPNSEQWAKAVHFTRGLSKIIQDEEKDFADAVVLHEGVTEVLCRIRQQEACQRAFSADPRALALQQWANEQVADKIADAELSIHTSGMVKQ